MSEKNEKSTLQLVLEFNAAAIGIPLVVLAIVYAYVKFYGIYLNKRIWKTVFFIIWSGTLLVFFREFLKTLFPYFKRSLSKKPTSLGAWEERKSVLIGKEIAIAAISIPALALFLIFIANQFLALNFQSKDWRQVIFILWIGTLASLVRVVLSKR